MAVARSESTQAAQLELEAAQVILGNIEHNQSVLSAYRK